ncbi:MULTISPECIES: hypothetical protein [unclassified Streptomyces]|uniref:hypothetical protein n=1 Tax=unclassified Streptomyces TaxID=2593676 RepID=UPI0035D6A8A6
MSKAEHETGPQGALVCPVCKQPVTTTVKKRHKTLGVFVPVWRPGPCHNSECPEYLEDPEHPDHRVD